MIRAISASLALLFVCLFGIVGPAAGGPQVQAMDLTPVTKTLTVGGLSFPVADYGSGPPVLLLHGFPDDRHLWRYQVPALAAAGFRVIAPDLRGFGDAPRPQDPKDYGIPLVVADVIGILDALGVKQVQLVCDFAKNTLGRLTGEPPKYPDDEKSLDDLKARIAKTIDYVKSFKDADIDALQEKDVTFPVGPQNTMTLKGAQYVLAFALPNFYFHATTAYDILRQAGVEIGKRDFLGRA